VVEVACRGYTCTCLERVPCSQVRTCKVACRKFSDWVNEILGLKSPRKPVVAAAGKLGDATEEAFRLSA
jgi:hypothetical protein